MKIVILKFLLLTTLNLFQPKPGLFDGFFKYVADNIHLQKQAKNSCKWQYALVKVKCNKTNKIISHSILNPIPSEIKQQFLFLDGYQFNKKIPVNQHAIIFCVTFENHTTDCVLKNLTLPTETLEKVFSELGKETAIDPKTIILYNILSLAYFEETIE